MIFEQQARAISTLRALRFTDRQARFLVQVMLHAGVCVERQYCAFAGIVHGQKSRDFFARLVAGGYATAHECGHKHRGRIYHVQHKALYRALGEPDNRNRKPMATPRAIERLMILDAVMDDPTLTWLATEREKFKHFAVLLHSRLTSDDLPHLTFGTGANRTIRYFADKLPIGIDSDQRHYVFLYLIDRRTPIDFRAFLQRHAELLRALPTWTIRVLVPRRFKRATPAYGLAFREEFGAPLQPAQTAELTWFFTERQRLGTGHPASDPERFRTAKRSFSTARFRALYRAWLRHGDAAIWSAQSRVLADALQRREGTIEYVALTRQYLHLSSLVGTA